MDNLFLVFERTNTSVRSEGETDEKGDSKLSCLKKMEIIFQSNLSF